MSLSCAAQAITHRQNLPVKPLSTSILQIVGRFSPAVRKISVLPLLVERGGAGGAGSDGPFHLANSGLFRLMIQAHASPQAAALLAVAH